ncbi:MAG: hypothetical protein HKP48_00260 [Winogradskyella sp.]|uniref:hypothetical protein n=1 Tax=Winogradskyella sp. TaxID=1883156 RepID=UPI00178EB429|nr:hypothetical protein [Winogradskyella sp.]MBT8245692.1 hypothetical protein [Winogradskyella sp.]NNK21748.1 hypothetical protein [Winogradskyella sp.]
MKKNILLIVFLSLNIAFQSCKNESGQDIVGSKIQLEGLTFNNNEKWVANEETHIGMQRIDSILKNNNATDGNVLGNILSKETSYIIKSCDMKGKAHDQLHIVLVPILEIITDLKDEKNTAEIDKKIKSLKQYTQAYFKYFKS